MKVKSVVVGSMLEDVALERASQVWKRRRFCLISDQCLGTRQTTFVVVNEGCGRSNQ